MRAIVSHSHGLSAKQVAVFKLNKYFCTLRYATIPYNPKFNYTEFGTIRSQAEIIVFQIAIQQMKVLEDSNNRKLLK